MASICNKKKDYTSVAKVLHWSMAFIWLSAWILGYLAVTWRQELNQSYGLTFTHKAIASTVIFLAVFRIFWRLTHKAPALPGTMKPLLRLVAHVSHFAIYTIALIGLPLSGWLWSSVADKPVIMLWIIPLPSLTSPHPELYNIFKDIHITTAYLMGVLVLGHILAAIKHALIDKDGVMESMMVKRK